MLRFGSFVGAMLPLLAASGCTMPSPVRQPLPQRILMVGNSFTFWNGGLWYPLQGMLGGKSAGAAVKSSVQGGASLRTHVQRRRLERQIREGNYDLIVLQGDIPESSVAEFEKSAAVLVARVRESGARPLLFMTWDYERLNWLSLEEIIAAHRRVADELQVPLAPVGEAWRRVRQASPDVDLYDRDREHPSLLGSYLSLIMLHAVIAGTDPRTEDRPLERAFRRIDEDDARWLREIAWETIRDEKQRPKR